MILETFFEQVKKLIIGEKRPKFYLPKKELVDKGIYYGTGIKETSLAKWSKEKEKFISLSDPELSPKDRILEYKYPDKKGKNVFYPIKKIN